MARKPTTVPKSKIEKLGEALTTKAKIPKTITLKELVQNLAKPIQVMLDAGYNYDEVAEVFVEQGVAIAASGLKSWHRKSQSPPDESAAEESLPAEPLSSVEDFPAEETEESKESKTSTAQASVRPRSSKSKFNSLDRSTL